MIRLQLSGLWPASNTGNQIAVTVRPTSVADAKSYLMSSFHERHHPLNRLVDDAAKAFLFSYTSLAAHRRFLTDAVHEVVLLSLLAQNSRVQVKSLIGRIEDTVLHLFPELRNEKDALRPYGFVDSVHPTPSSFRHDFIEPLFFSRIHSVLFALYNLNVQVLHFCRLC
jgi:hypothetical protein